MMASSFSLTETLRTLSHILLPVRCASCDRPLAGDPVPFFCRTCWAQLKPISGPECARCGRPFASPISTQYSPGLVCADCRRHPPAYARAWSCYRYEPPLQDAIQLLKYQRKVALASPLAALFAHRPVQPSAFDLIMPVPLHADRLREREFNQALLLADRLATALNLPLSYDHLIRTKATAPQSELNRAARLQNLRRTFAVRAPDDIQGKRILLVDDVFTTGTTVNECAKVLRKAGAGPVSACTVARAV
ncbi:MAG: ComF family protein [Nitrospirae bacterium]|nr:ComF family protein [Nitrospirota bacterium]